MARVSIHDGQNFWIALLAWVATTIVMALVSLMTEPRPDSELKSLVYGLTELPRDEGVAWYRRPVFLAVVAGFCVYCLTSCSGKPMYDLRTPAGWFFAILG